MLLNNTFLNMTLEKYNLPKVYIAITDVSGRILASSENKAVGTTDTTAKYVINSKRSAIIDVSDKNNTEETSLVQFGTIILHNNIIQGAIVASGDQNVAVAQGNLIKAALETAYEYNSFIENINHTSNKNSTIALAILNDTLKKDEIIALMHRMEIDPYLLRSVICISLSHHQTNYFNINLSLGYQASVEHIINEAVTRLKSCKFLNTQDFVFAYDRNTILVIKSFFKNSNLTRAYLSLDKISQEISKIMNTFSSFSYHIAYGNLYHDISDVKSSFKEAIETIHIGKKAHPDTKFYTLEDLMFDTICHTLDTQIINKLIEPNISFLTDENGKIQNDLIVCAEAFIDNCFNISKTSNQLYLHRNTVSSKLNKFTELTSLEPSHNITDAFMVKMIATYLKIHK